MDIDIKERRKELDLTQMELASEVGVSVDSIRKWEWGGGTPSPENERKLKKALEVKDE